MKPRRPSPALPAVLLAAAALAAGCVKTVPLLSPEQKAWFDQPRAERVAQFKDPAFRATMKSWGDKPARVPFWRPDDPSPQNFEIGATGRFAQGDLVRVFRTEDHPPRLLDVPGIPNARDFGGWRGLGGRRVKQGLVIRSAGLNENATPREDPDTPGATRVTEATRAVLVGQLGVKTDIDLRWDKEVWGMTGSPLGPEVRWVRCPWSLYQWIAGDEEKAMFAKIFRLLLDPANLPAVVHCIEGQDRTGTLCFLLNGLLGVSEDDLMRDWEATGLANDKTGFRHESRIDPLVKYLDTFPGDTIREKCEGYAHASGIADEEIAAWRALMLEEKP